MSKIKSEVGMRMKCAISGEGNIQFTTNPDYPLQFKSKTYTEDGKILLSVNILPTLKLIGEPFTQGLGVDCDIFGGGVVRSIYEGIKSVYVLFENGHEQVYTSDGRIFPKANITLFPKYEI